MSFHRRSRRGCCSLPPGCGPRRCQAAMGNLLSTRGQSAPLGSLWGDRPQAAPGISRSRKACWEEPEGPLSFPHGRKLGLRKIKGGNMASDQTLSPCPVPDPPVLNTKARNTPALCVAQLCISPSSNSNHRSALLALIASGLTLDPCCPTW